MQFDDVYDDLRGQFISIARGFIPVLADRSLEITDLVQEGMILTLDLCERYNGKSRRHFKSIAVVSFVNFLKDYSRLRYSQRKREDNTHYENAVEVLCDESVPEKLMFSIFIAELSDLLSRLDADVLRELIEPNKSALEAMKQRQQTSVFVGEVHISRALKRPHHEVRRSIKRIQSAVANEFFLI